MIACSATIDSAPQPPHVPAGFKKMHASLKVFFAAGAVTAVGSGAAIAQLAVDEHLRRSLEAPLSSKEVLVDRAQFVEIEQGETREFVFQIDPGERYTIYGGCDDDCSDINLVARSPSGELVDEDVEDDEEPLVLINPGESQNAIRVTLSLVSCDTETCIAGVAMFRSR